MNGKYDLSVDLRGLCCAEPIIRIANALKTLSPGKVLCVSADKVSMLKDIPAFCNQTGNALLRQSENQGVFEFWIRRGAQETSLVTVSGPTRERPGP